MNTQIHKGIDLSIKIIEEYKFKEKDIVKKIAASEILTLILIKQISLMK